MAMQTVIIEGARIGFRNFSGAEGKYNREGDRNFVVFLDDELASAMANDGWNIKTLNPREEGDLPQAYLPVKVSFKGRPPKIVMITSRGKTPINEDMVSLVDWAEITNVDLTINPYEWNVNGKSGVTAYLKTAFITIFEDALDLKYADVPDSAASAMPVVREADDAWERDSYQGSMDETSANRHAPNAAVNAAVHTILF